MALGPLDDAGEGTPQLLHTAEAVESKLRVRERLARALSREKAVGDPQVSRGLDASGDELPPARSGLGVEGNPLGEYLLNCELRAVPFRL
jgi:hypothetical protein